MLGVKPAYGRDYKSQKEVKAAWAEGKDFVITDIMHPNSGAYVNKNDAPKGKICIRYKQLRNVCVIDNK